MAIALAKSLGLEDDGSSGETCPTNRCQSLKEPSDKEVGRLKVRVHLHDDKELHSSAGADAEELQVDADFRQAVHEVDRGSDARRAVGRRLVRNVAFGVIAGVLVTAAFAWQLHGDVQSSHMADAAKLHRDVVSMKASRSDVVPVEVAAKISDRVPTQDTALQQAVPAVPPAQVSVAPGLSSDLQQQLETLATDVAVVRRIVERLATIQEQMVVDIAMLQRSGQKASLPTHPPAVVVPPRKYSPNTARSDVAAQSPPVPVPPALTRTPATLH